MESFTRIPNNVIDESLLNPYQFQLFSIIVRKTDGWCKVEDGISLSQFEKLVCFKKNKIVNTLKELEELGFIEKTRHYNDELKTFSYSTYKISKRVVSENNKGSISHKQGVVSEKDKQDKLITKETNTLTNNHIPNIINILNLPANELTDKDFTLSKLTSYDNLSSIYKEKLEEFLNKYIEDLELKILNANGNKKTLQYEDFILSLEAKGYKYKNFISAYKTWNRGMK